jgi:hypothetical protein
MENKQIHFSISKNLLILASAIALAFLIIIACLILKDNGRYGMNGSMMRNGTMRQQQRDRMMNDQNDGRMRGPQNDQPAPAMPAVRGQMMEGTVMQGDTSATGSMISR